MVLKQLFILVALCASHVSFGMQSDLDDALHKAVCYGTVDQVKELLENGSSVNAMRYGKHVLHSAAMRNREEVCELLIKKGVNVNAQDSKGQTALLIAAERTERSMICKLLIEAGADVNKPCDRGWTPLLTCSGVCIDIMGQLLAAGADCNLVRNMCGSTPLMWAAESCCVSSCELLLQYGADPECCDKNGRRAIDEARLKFLELFEADETLELEKLRKIIALLSDPDKIRAVIMREDNPCLEMKPWRETSPNIFNALLGREMGGR